MSVIKLYHDLKARGVLFEVDGEHLVVDAPSGELTQEDREALHKYKPVLLPFLSRVQARPQDEPQSDCRSSNAGSSQHLQEGPALRSKAHWVGPRRIKILDPFTAEWHEWPASRCLPGIVAEADRNRKKGA